MSYKSKLQKTRERLALLARESKINDRDEHIQGDEFIYILYIYMLYSVVSCLYIYIRI